MILNHETESGVSLGIDVGSTTAKLVVIRNGEIIHRKYERHYSEIRKKVLEMLEEAAPMIGTAHFTAAISGSAGLGIANGAGIPFVQEVYATGEVIKSIAPDTSAIIELGGEDAKIIFFEGGTDERMNGSCAGGTGAFIDQMATLLDMTPDEMDEISLNCKKIYPIASRCGVFAKTDVQPLLNQGAAKADVAASIYQAVVNQTIAGLAQGRKITGKVMFLGGPLYFCKGLRKRFAETLELDDEHAIFPEYGRIACALGASLYAAHATEGGYTITKLCEDIKNAKIASTSQRMEPLFASEAEYAEFKARHDKASVPVIDIASYSGKAYLGIDCGSTTTKLVLISERKDILYTYYSSNKGDPIEIVRGEIEKIYSLCGDRITICGSAVTGYGEELIKNAFKCDIGMVETIAHYTAAKYFKPEVDFILDIGGQDIKCFRIRNNAIDSIMLNEACSSGCGSFIETFARSMHCPIAEFAEKGLFADAPVNLGSRCTVFMNSQVKQSQKDGATVADISAGLSVSVVKNAIYKVIRAHSPDELGQNIVVQGGTFHNDAILRAFEREIGRTVTRPSIAGLMGAYGAALYSMACKESSLISREQLAEFSHSSKTTVCKGCANQCLLTVNTFSDGGRFISGNKCEKGAGKAIAKADVPNLHEYKRTLLTAMHCEGEKAERGTIGLPLSLGMYELLPLWYGIFKSLGFRVIHSGLSSRQIYEKGHFSIPSDTACYPAKIMHGHMELLVEQNADAIFYPRLTWNINEKEADNHYNCPVVAYYSELLRGNMDSLRGRKFLYPYLNINNKKELAKELLAELNGELHLNIKPREMKAAGEAGFREYNAYMDKVRAEGERAVRAARENGMRIMILAGRPYHIDPEIGHGIDQLAASLGFAVVSEDSVYHMAHIGDVHVLNQWTYHARLYRAAEYAALNPDVELVQLVSFGCGVDAITTDEVKRILENKGKYYTQIKIDEITNLGAVKIRLRSLLAAITEERKGENHE